MYFLGPKHKSAIWQKGVKICNSDEPFFFLSHFQLMADRVIFDIGWVVDKVCIYTMKG